MSLEAIISDGFGNWVKRNSFYLLNKLYFANKKRLHLSQETWHDINFKALGIDAHARILLNPFDEGFSRWLSIYGFWEPLNTTLIYNYVSKTKPRILDIGANLGYFALVELEAGARKVVAVEPEPSTYNLLSKTLQSYSNSLSLNVAISDREEPIRLYIANERSASCTSKSCLLLNGQKILGEIITEAVTIASLAEFHQISMIRMDVEGAEFKILSGKIPDQVNGICLELHVIPPYNKTHAQALLKHLAAQGFKPLVLINGISYVYFPLVEWLGLSKAYRTITLFGNLSEKPLVQYNPSLNELFSVIPRNGIFEAELFLQR